MSAGSGRFFWFDLMTSDVEAAKAFYCEAIGWKIEVFEEGGKPYPMLIAGERPIGGVMELPEEARAMGAPPHWAGYLVVEDVDATCKRAVELGGKVLKEAFDIPNVGRIAAIADPQGANFGLLTAVNETPVYDSPSKPGEVSWHELNTNDYEGAWAFYSELFGWEATESMDMGPEAGTYFMYRWPGLEGSAGGMSNAAKTMKTPPAWLYYFSVDNLDAALERVKSNGGKVLNGPMEVPGGDRVAQCMDPQGAAFAIHSSN